MSLRKYIKEYKAIPNPKIISKFIRYLNKTFDDKKFVKGGLWNGKKAYEDKTVRERVVDAGNSVGSFFGKVGDGIVDGYNNVRERLSNSEDENQEEESPDEENV